MSPDKYGRGFERTLKRASSWLIYEYRERASVNRIPRATCCSGWSCFNADFYIVCSRPQWIAAFIYELLCSGVSMCSSVTKQGVIVIVKQNIEYNELSLSRDQNRGIPQRFFMSFGGVWQPSSSENLIRKSTDVVGEGDKRIIDLSLNCTAPLILWSPLVCTHQREGGHVSLSLLYLQLLPSACCWYSVQSLTMMCLRLGSIGGGGGLTFLLLLGADKAQIN